MPITRDNRYNYQHVPLTVEVKTTPGIDVAVCKECGAVVIDTKLHNKHHKEQDK